MYVPDSKLSTPGQVMLSSVHIMNGYIVYCYILPLVYCHIAADNIV